MDKQQEFVLRTLEERDIRFVRLWFTDVLGFLKSVAVAPAELEGAFAEGIGFDGSAIEGFARVYEADMLAKPDPSTFQVLPWRGERAGHRADVLRHPDAGRLAVASPTRATCSSGRWRKAADLGFTFYTHPEIEFFLFKREPDAGRQPGARSTTAATSTTPRTASATTSAAPRSPCSSRWASRWSSATTRARPGQQEIDLRYADALTTADNIMTFRTGGQGGRARAGRLRVVHAQAVRRAPGLRACTPTCRCSRATATPSTRPARRTSCRKIGRSFIAGLLQHAAEITAVTNQWVNSYKRLWGGGEAPAYVCWGHNNRSALVRVPMYKPQQGPVDPRRVPLARLRVQPLPRVRACCSPPGSRASRRATSCPPGAEDDVWALTDAERRALGIEPLPRSLGRGDRA